MTISPELAAILKQRRQKDDDSSQTTDMVNQTQIPVNDETLQAATMHSRPKKSLVYKSCTAAGIEGIDTSSSKNTASTTNSITSNHSKETYSLSSTNQDKNEIVDLEEIEIEEDEFEEVEVELIDMEEIQIEEIETEEIEVEELEVEEIEVEEIEVDEVEVEDFEVEEIEIEEIEVEQQEINLGENQVAGTANNGEDPIKESGIGKEAWTFRSEVHRDESGFPYEKDGYNGINEEEGISEIRDLDNITKTHGKGKSNGMVVGNENGGAPIQESSNYQSEGNDTIHDASSIEEDHKSSRNSWDFCEEKSSFLLKTTNNGNLMKQCGNLANPITFPKKEVTGQVEDKEKKMILKRSHRGDIITTGGSLALPITHINISNDECGNFGNDEGKKLTWEKPRWAVKSTLKPTELGQAIKSGKKIEREITHINYKSDDSTMEKIGWKRPDWAKNSSLKVTDVGKAMKSKGNLAQPITVASCKM